MVLFAYPGWHGKDGVRAPFQDRRRPGERLGPVKRETLHRASMISTADLPPAARIVTGAA
jgi:hypothetical protein